MQVSNPNNVKIYNLSAGKSLPEWLSDRKKRLIQKKDAGVRNRIQLIQDFEMPGISNQVQISRDGQFILVTGIYKPRVRCYDVNQLSMKFERCFDAEIVKFLMLSDDYSKIVFLQADRSLEFHVAYGKYYKIRIPKFGRDLAYHQQSCDLYCVGASSEIYRLNLDQGRFLNPLQTEAGSINVCKINPFHQLFVCGTEEGRVEAWDPRQRTRAAILDCAFSAVTQDTEVNGVPSITSLSFFGDLVLGVGTATGQILMYDIRSPKPFLVKDHLYGLPILDIEFHQDLVLSADAKIVKLWERNNGKPFTSIQAAEDLNNLCLVPNTGMIFLANEERKVMTYFIPSLGPAPKWCSFLDSLTEELEETNQDNVYDDYRFVTKKELDELGLGHLLGSPLMRAYMHGYFMDVRLYKKAKTIADPFAYADYRRRRIREKVESERENRVQLRKLPRVNKELAQKMMEKHDEAVQKRNKKKKMPNLMEDSRFKALFENPDFEVDKTCDEYRLINPLVNKAENAKKKKKVSSEFRIIEENASKSQNANDSSENSSEGEDSEDYSSDDDRTWTKEVKWQHKLLRQEAKIRQREEDEETELTPRFYEMQDSDNFGRIKEINRREANASLGDRLRNVEEVVEADGAIGAKSVTYIPRNKKDPKQSKREAANRKHMEERKKVRRSTKGIQSKRGKSFTHRKRN